MEVKCIPVGRVDVGVIEGDAGKYYLYRSVDNLCKRNIGLADGRICEIKSRPGDRMMYHLYEYSFEHTDLMPEYIDVKKHYCAICDEQGKEKGYHVKGFNVHLFLEHLWTAHRKQYWDNYKPYLERIGMMRVMNRDTDNEEYLCMCCYHSRHGTLLTRLVPQPSFRNMGDKVRFNLKAKKEKKYRELSRLASHIFRHHQTELNLMMNGGLRNNDEDTRYVIDTLISSRLMVTKDRKEKVREVRNTTMKSLDTYRVVCVAIKEGIEMEVLVDDTEFLKKLVNCGSYKELEAYVNFSQKRLQRKMCKFEDKIKKATNKFLGTPKEPITVEAG